MNTPGLNAIANCLRIVSHPNRLAIALLLLDGPCAVSEIESVLELRQPNLSQHLGILRDANLLNAKRQAKSVVYELVDGTPRELVSAIRNVIETKGTSDGENATAESGESTTMRNALFKDASSVAKARPHVAHALTTRALSTEPEDGLMFAHVLNRCGDE